MSIERAAMFFADAMPEPGAAVGGQEAPTGGCRAVSSD